MNSVLIYNGAMINLVPKVEGSELLDPLAADEDTMSNFL